MSRLNPLTLTEITARLGELEQKYGFGTADFLRLREEDLRRTVTEDDVLMWEAYVDFKRELAEMEGDVHRRYLTRITHGAEKSASVSAAVELAA